MLYSTVALGVFSRSPMAGTAMLTWLLIFVAPCRMFVGGHYPTDIAVGLLLGWISYSFCRWITPKISLIDRIAASESPSVITIVAVWMLEVSHGFADVRSVVNLFSYLRPQP